MTSTIPRLIAELNLSRPWHVLCEDLLDNLVILCKNLLHFVEIPFPQVIFCVESSCDCEGAIEACIPQPVWIHIAPSFVANIPACIISTDGEPRLLA